MISGPEQEFEGGDEENVELVGGETSGAGQDADRQDSGGENRGPDENGGGEGGGRRRRRRRRGGRGRRRNRQFDEFGNPIPGGQGGGGPESEQSGGPESSGEGFDAEGPDEAEVFEHREAGSEAEATSSENHVIPAETTDFYANDEVIDGGIGEAPSALGDDEADGPVYPSVNEVTDSPVDIGEAPAAVMDDGHEEIEVVERSPRSVGREVVKAPEEPPAEEKKPARGRGKKATKSSKKSSKKATSEPVIVAVEPSEDAEPSDTTVASEEADAAPRGRSRGGRGRGGRGSRGSKAEAKNDDSPKAESEPDVATARANASSQRVPPQARSESSGSSREKATSQPAQAKPPEAKPAAPQPLAPSRSSGAASQSGVTVTRMTLPTPPPPAPKSEPPKPSGPTPLVVPPMIRVVRTGWSDKHLATDQPVDPELPGRPQNYGDLDVLPEED